jgi:hypothetical protein
MLDQVPRNALAVQYGPFHDSDPLDVRTYIDDSYSYNFALLHLDIDKLKLICDTRIVCFYSLIFRHSNDLASARMVLMTLNSSDDDHDFKNLPPLALKFWSETEKRGKQL